MLRAGREEAVAGGGLRVSVRSDRTEDASRAAGDLVDEVESDMEDEMIDGYDLERSLAPGCRVCAEQVHDKEEAITAIPAGVNCQSQK